MMRFILASKSPRRSFFLRERGYLFHTFPVEISEFLDKNLNISVAVEDLAQRKARALVETIQKGSILDPKSHYLILAADTIVFHKGNVLGKPMDQNDAFQTLRRLSGDTHQVITAFCLWNTLENRFVTSHSTSDVTFRPLTDEEIWQYVRSGDPLDKAGSYGIQSLARGFIKKNSHQIQGAKEEQLGSTFRTEGQDFVTSFTGSLENIAGLPIDDVERVAREQGWEFPRN
jgi:septum formation protein